jgi:GT2 family glycosyltransferase
MGNEIVDIIILNYKNYNDTIECIESILNNVYKNFRIILIDNCSNDESVTMIKKYIYSTELADSFLEMESNQLENKARLKKGFIKCYLIKSNKNLGYGGGNNLGIKLSLMLGDAEYIWILNNDTIIDENAIIAQIREMRSNPKALICGSKIYYYGTNNIYCLAGAKFNKWTMTSKNVTSKDINNIDKDKIVKKIDYICGASMFFRKDFFIKYGLFDEKFFLYFEEIDMVSRVKDRKDFLCFASDSIIYHKVGASLGSSRNLEKKSLVAEYHSFRSRIIFTKKYYPFKLPLVYLLGVLYIIHRLINKKFKHSFQILKAMIES